MSSYIVVFDLGLAGASVTPVVLRKFDQHRIASSSNGRVVKGKDRVRQYSGPQEEVPAAVQEEPAETREDDAASDGDSSDEDDLPQNSGFPIVTRTATSPDGQWLATTDTQGHTFIFNLDSVTYHATLPTFALPVQALGFDTTHPNILTIGLANNTLEVYDVETRSFPRWAQNVVKNIPERFTHLHEPMLGVTFDPGAAVTPNDAVADGNHEDTAMAEDISSPPRSALLWGATWLCRVKLDVMPAHIHDKRRRWEGPRGKRGDADGEVGKPEKNFAVVVKYRPTLFVDFIGPRELVVVERPLVDVMQRLPPAFFKPKYGHT